MKVRFILWTLILANSLIANSQTYFGYEKRSPQAQVDWGQISSDLSYDLKAISDNRTSQKQRFYNITRESLSGLQQNSFRSKYDAINDIISKAKIATSKEISQLYSELTQGKIDPSHYEKYLNNINDQISVFISIFEKIESTYIVPNQDVNETIRRESSLIGYADQVQFKYKSEFNYRTYKYYTRQNITLLESGMETPLRNLFDKIIQVCNE